MGRYFGIAAVDLVVQRDFGRLVSLTNGKIVPVPLDIVKGSPKTVDTEHEYDIDRYNGRRSILSSLKRGAYDG